MTHKRRKPKRRGSQRRRKDGRFASGFHDALKKGARRGGSLL